MRYDEYQTTLDSLAALREQFMALPEAQDPRNAEALSNWTDRFEALLLNPAADPPPAADRGLSALIGIGPNAAASLGDVNVPLAVDNYDDDVASERIYAMANLYYVYQHEKVGVFRAVEKLHQLFQAGAVRLSGGDGAYALYHWDRQGVLRFTKRERLAAYCRGLGYCAAPAPAGARPNREFHHLFTHFVREVAIFWRDKRISEVMRERANDPTFGSIATVRRAGLDLRNNLKFVSYGHLNVLTAEVMQLLDDAFRILGAADVRNLFGADSAWDVAEEVLTRYFGEHINTSPRQRMATAGREILRWLGQAAIRQTTRAQFEGLLLEIAEYAEEWLTSAESLGIAEPRNEARLLPYDRERRGPRAVKQTA